MYNDNVASNKEYQYQYRDWNYKNKYNNQMEIIDLESTITDIKKNHWDSTDRKWQQKELTNLKIVDRNYARLTREGKTMKTNEQRLRELWNNIKNIKIYIRISE